MSQPLNDLRYKHVEAALARVLRIPEPGMKAFRARIRHLRRLGVPTLASVGSGTHLTYTLDNVRQLLIALELEGFNVDPIVIGNMVRASWKHLGPKIDATRDARQDRFLVMLPHFIGEMGAFDESITIPDPCSRDELVARYLRDASAARFGVVCLTSQLKRLDAELTKAMAG